MIGIEKKLFHTTACR